MSMQVFISEYDSQWPQQYAVYEERIATALAGMHCLIEHVGSTSVPNLAAKPTIDVQIGVQREDDLDLLHDRLTAAGLTRNPTWDKDLPFRRFFQHLKKHDGSEVNVASVGVYQGDLRADYQICANIHCVPIDSEWWKRHLLFRDFLRANEEARCAYEDEKKRLSKLEWRRVADYAGGKDSIIALITERAKKWQEDRSKS